MIEVLTSGIQTTIQDGGRFKSRKYGVPLSGFMDSNMANRANLVAGNQRNAPLIEFAYQGPTLGFSSSCRIVIAACGVNPLLNGHPIELNTCHDIKQGDQLKIGNLTRGTYGYIALSGGIDSKIVLNSQSYYKGICDEGLLTKGDRINESSQYFKTSFEKPTLPVLNYDSSTIPVYRGLDFEGLEENVKERLIQSLFEISSEISRMGYLLNGKDQLGAEGIITAPVQPGTIQLTPAGKLIALMRDAQTTGGYARVLQLTEKGINMMAQKSPFAKIKFRLVD